MTGNPVFVVAGEVHMYDMIEVTSLNRPDTSWRFTDAGGHLHAWYVDGQIADSYRPSARHELPTLRWVVDSEGTDDYPEIGHYECVICAAHVKPGRCADNTRQFIPGLRY